MLRRRGLSVSPRFLWECLTSRTRLDPLHRVLALFAVGDVYVSLCKKSAYTPFSVRRRSRAPFWL